jgi:opacity protein-like surface antigen
MVTGMSSQAAAEPTATWSGFYIGAGGGYGLGSLGLSFEDEAAWDGFGMKGWTAGGFIGFDHVFGSNLVAGVEIGGDWSNIGTEMNLLLGDGSGYDYLFNGWMRTDWTASVSARLGLIVNPYTMFFGSIGATAGQMSYGYEYGEDDSIITQFSDGKTFYGLAFAGIGAETYLADHLRFRYQYVLNFLSHDFDGLEVSPTQGIAKVALMYDFGGPPSPDAAAAFAPQSWTGIYFGINGGHSMGRSSLVAEEGPSSFYWDAFGATGLNAGASVGADIQLGSSFVLGIEAGATASNLEWEASYGPYGIRYTNNNWYDVRGRLGVLVNPGTLLYGFVGYAKVHSSLDYYEDVYSEEIASFTRKGWEFGGGIEAWVASNLSLRAEYGIRKLDNYSILDDTIWLETMQSTATFGAIYHIGK